MEAGQIPLSHIDRVVLTVVRQVSHSVEVVFLKRVFIESLQELRIDRTAS
jgi:hypothetical protein